MQSVTFKSSDDGSRLTFEITYRDKDEIAFNVSVQTSTFSGTVSASTFMVLPPDHMFRAMADSWQGWKTPLTWSDLESRVSFESTCDSTGHVKITVKLTDIHFESYLYAVLRYEVGQLEGMANEISSIFR
jgi:hypothetical protein